MHLTQTFRPPALTHPETRLNAQTVIIVEVVGVVGEAIMLLFRIVQQKVQTHPIAGLLAIGERAHTPKDGHDAGILAGHQSSPRSIPIARLRSHPFEV
jgi:hypothetical protein